MNALPSFEPPQQRPPRRKSTSRAQQRDRLRSATAPAAPQPRSRSKSNPVYAHRRRGIEVAIELITYSSLSLFGIVTIVNSIGYNWAQRGKLQHLATELQDARIRTAKVNRNFTHSFDPHAQKMVMEENSYKVAADRLQIIIANPAPAVAPNHAPAKPPVTE